MTQPKPPITMREVTDPVENAKAHKLLARFDRNWQWLQTHVQEVDAHRGKHICIAGQELFVGDSPEDVLAKARAAHPEEDAPYLQYVHSERLPRIYAI